MQVLLGRCEACTLAVRVCSYIFGSWKNDGSKIIVYSFKFASLRVALRRFALFIPSLSVAGGQFGTVENYFLMFREETVCACATRSIPHIYIYILYIYIYSLYSCQMEMALQVRYYVRLGTFGWAILCSHKRNIEGELCLHSCAHHMACLVALRDTAAHFLLSGRCSCHHRTSWLG